MTVEDDNNARTNRVEAGDGAARIRIVLVEPSHPGNVGAAARAMKTMTLSRLHLIKPSRFPSAEATARAAGADDILYRAAVHDDLQDALSGCCFVVGTSARARHLQWPALAPRGCASKLVEQSVGGSVAMVFGRENSGLTNQELELCHAVVRIPTSSTFSSLNVAAAVQILCYEVRLALSDLQGTTEELRTRDAVTSEQLEGFYEHLRTTLIQIGYLDESAPKLLMRRLRRLFSRAGVERAELNILRGVLAAVQHKIRR